VKLPFATYDVFTARKFGGNPLAIVMDADRLSTEQMQTIAREFNLSETIFVMAPQDAANTARVRIFFPVGEIPFAGHPTLGCAIHLASRKYKQGCSFETEIRLEEQAGLVPVKVSRIGDVPRAMLTAPVIPYAVDVPLPSAQEAALALSLTSGEIGFGNHSIGVHEGGPRFLYVPVKNRAALITSRVCEPHWSALMQRLGVDSAYLYTEGGDHAETAFRARMYSPTAGIPEDPATGSATALLASQLRASGVLRDGLNRFRLEQGYEMGRPSDLTLEIGVRESKLEAVRVAGQAVQVMEGVLDL